MADAKIVIPKEGLPDKTDNVTKLDLTKVTEDLKKEEPKVEEVVEQKEETQVEQVAEDVNPIEEIKLEEVKEEVVVEEQQTIETPVEPAIDLPENVEKLVDFMKETGGTVQDYVRLNHDYSNVSSDALLKEFYKQTKPHLDDEEVSFILEEKFKFDEDNDDERNIKRKKLAQKEEVAKAHKFLTELKDKYYDEIKLRPSVTQEQKKATDFFNRYNEDKSKVQKQHERFKSDTSKLFSNDFKGFDFKVGEKNYRYGIKNPKVVSDNQSNLNNFVGKFLDSEGNVKDPKGYHKAVYAAENIDNIITHFYEQGKSDAVKDVVDRSKNPSSNDRPTQVTIGGLKVKAISGMDSSKLRINKKFNT